jgi:hypothetical protein
VIGLLSNPEILRNVRAQLRPDRIAITAALCAAGALAVGAGMATTYRATGQPHRWGLEYLAAVLYAQTAALLLIGGLSAAHTIQREREANTFDFQRMTRLTGLELSWGKLIGAPALAYFVVICLLPAAIVGAIDGRVPVTFVVAAYAVMILGALCFHALALLMSLLFQRGAAVGVIVLLILALGLDRSFTGQLLFLGTVSPFAASGVVRQTGWAVDRAMVGDGFGWLRQPLFMGSLSGHQLPMTDLFFGRPVHHVFVLIVLYLGFVGWFLTPVARNIKRDPAIYALYTLPQALGLAAYVNLILLGFFRWSQFEPLTAQAILLAINSGLFFGLGLALLHSRDYLRRAGPAAGSRPFAAAWPAPSVAAGFALVNLAGLGVMEWIQALSWGWGVDLALFRIAFLAASIARDILFLQWMNLRPGRRSLPLGLLILGVFYACAGIVLSTGEFFGTPEGLVYRAVVVPPWVLALARSDWALHRTTWLLAFGIQVLAGGAFVGLQRRRLADLLPGTAPPAATAL